MLRFMGHKESDTTERLNGNLSREETYLLSRKLEDRAQRVEIKGRYVPVGPMAEALGSQCREPWFEPWPGN